MRTVKCAQIRLPNKKCTQNCLPESEIGYVGLGVFPHRGLALANKGTYASSTKCIFRVR
jgi:hypothetical protein